MYLSWLVSHYVIKLCGTKIRIRKSIAMAEKKNTDLQQFIETVNKKDGKVKGKKIRFAFVKRKRKN